jgi:glyoxylase-like metal-dependent hydrolase (beta-lactamase superfamily II)
MERVIDGVYFIKGEDEFIPDSHVYIIGEPTADDLTMVDVGLVRKGNNKIDAILKMGIRLASIKRIIMTHTHLDHIGCLSEIIDNIPHAELWVHKSEAELLERGDDRAVYGMEMLKEMCKMQYGLGNNAFRFKVHRRLEGGETIDAGDTSWKVLHIPGHSMGGIGLYNHEKRVLIPGDVVYADYAIGRFDLYGANPEELLRSLTLLSELEIDTLLPGHNRIEKGLPADYIKKIIKMWRPYLA